MDIVSRKDASAAGLKHYFTGKPCRNGHIDQRFVSSFWCMACARDRANRNYAALSTDSRKSLVRDRKEYQRQYRERNLDRLKVNDAAQRKAYKEKRPDYFREHYAKNKDRKKQQAKAWYRANTEHAIRVRRLYEAAHPEQCRVHGRRSANTRRARTKLAFVEVVDPKTVFRRDDGICGICRERVEMKSNWEIDHVIPLSKGGQHSYSNVQLTHRTCNRSKAAKVVNA